MNGMSEPQFRIDPLTGACVAITPWRQDRPNLPAGSCPFCPGGLEAPDDYDVRCITNRWPALPAGRHEVVLHSPHHTASFRSLGNDGTARVIELWSERTVRLGARDDVGYVFVFENNGRAIGATIDHPHSQILAFADVPPVPLAELGHQGRQVCELCGTPAPELTVTRQRAWLARIPWAPSWPYEMVLSPDRHVADLPEAGRSLRAELGAILVECLSRLEVMLGEADPYMLWIHQRPTDGKDWPAAHLHLHLAPVLRARGTIRHLAAAEFGAGVFFDPVDPPQAASRLRAAGRHPPG
jgi:UDPglucose--hexose-1-phosphate uridylyltransferase